ncbi:cell division/cell wall cluster transcriptional repressor MraZ [Pseudooceanicola aestuarii]|uniref:division/cell wall cluster transcriptional repressor MraZ n=1 Tax=Pseudooceanicola aestuarii TaxID=2697319 RepID=UPI001EF869A0
MDSKGRVSVPSSIRRVLEEQDPDWVEGRNPTMVVVYGDHLKDNLEGYSVETMAEKEAKIDRMPGSHAKTRALKRFFLGQSQELSVDDTGRIVLPAKLRRKIGVEPGGTAYFIGNGKTFEIWHPETYRAHSERIAAQWLDEEGADFDPETLFDEIDLGDREAE